MNQLALDFSWSGIPIRTITTGPDEIWFVGRDVAVALGHKNPERAIREYVDDEDKGVTVSVTPGGKQQVVIINEPGVYSLVLASRTEGARAFKRWVTHEVLPAIRKQGYYSLFSDEETLEIITHKIALGLKAPSNLPIAKRPSFADKLNRQALKQEAIEAIRAERYHQIQQLWKSDFYSSESAEFTKKLQAICQGDSTMYHKYFDLYMKQKDPKFKDIIVI